MDAYCYGERIYRKLELEKMQRSFDKIQNELEEIKNQDKASTEIEDMYKIAEQNAQWVPFAKHPLMKETNKQKKTDYIILLLYCLSLDKGLNLYLLAEK